MRALLVVFSIFLLSSCATVQQVHEKGVEVADKAFTAAHIAFCDAQSTGSVRRHFTRNRQGLILYFKVCGWEDSLIPYQPSIPQDAIGPVDPRQDL